MPFTFSVNVNGNTRQWTWGSNGNTQQGQGNAPQLADPFSHFGTDAFGLFQQLGQHPGAQQQFLSGESPLAEMILRHALEQSMQGPSGPAPCVRQAVDKLPKATLQEGDTAIGTACAVCLEDFTVGSAVTTLPCDHNFHPQCVSHWLLQHNSCPTCRKAVPEPELPASSTTAPPPEQPAASDTGIFSHTARALAGVGAWLSSTLAGAGVHEPVTADDEPQAEAPAEPDLPRPLATERPADAPSAATDVSPTTDDSNHEVWREVREDAARLSVRELRSQIAELGGSSDGVLEKSELVARYLECLGCDAASLAHADASRADVEARTGREELLAWASAASASTAHAGGSSAPSHSSSSSSSPSLPADVETGSTCSTGNTDGQHRVGGAFASAIAPELAPSHSTAGPSSAPGTASTPDTDQSPLIIGAAVTVTGLKNAALNGKRATVRGWDGATSRYDVQIEGLAETRLIKPENLRQVDGAEAEVSPEDRRLDDDVSAQMRTLQRPAGCVVALRMPDGCRRIIHCYPEDVLAELNHPDLEYCMPTGAPLDKWRTVGELGLDGAVVCLRKKQDS